MSECAVPGAFHDIEDCNFDGLEKSRGPLCHSRESWNPLILACSGLLLEFTLAEAGAGVTDFLLFTTAVIF